MKQKKIAVMVLTLMLLLVSFSAVNAFDWSFSSSSSSSASTESGGASVEVNGNTLKVQGLEFKLPKDYKEDEKERILGNDSGKEGDQNGTKITSTVLKNGDKSVAVKVIYSPDGSYQFTNMVKSKDSQVEKTIGEHKGLISTEDGVTTFGFVKDSKLVEIDAPDEATITQLLA